MSDQMDPAWERSVPSWDSWMKDHMAGLHQEEIVGLIKKIEPHLHGHSRAIILFTLTRLIAVMLGPAGSQTREGYLEGLVPMLKSMLVKIDQMVEIEMRKR